MTFFTVFISIAGIFYAISVGVYSLSTNPANTIASVYQKAFDDFFVVLSTGLSISGWLLFLSTAGATTPLVAALFVLAEMVFVMKALINIGLFYGYDTPATNPQASAEIQGQQRHAVMAFEAYKQAMWVNLVTAIWLTLIIAGWCLVPEGLVVGALSLMAMGLVYWAKHVVLQRVEETMAAALQPTVDAAAPWWEDPCELQRETRPRLDLNASNDVSCEMNRDEDRHHEPAPAMGMASQTGLFSRKSTQVKVGFDGFVLENQRGPQSVMLG